MLLFSFYEKLTALHYCPLKNLRIDTDTPQHSNISPACKSFILALLQTLSSFSYLLKMLTPETDAVFQYLLTTQTPLLGNNFVLAPKKSRGHITTSTPPNTSYSMKFIAINIRINCLSCRLSPLQKSIDSQFTLPSNPI